MSNPDVSDVSDMEATRIRSLPKRFVTAPGNRIGKYVIVEKVGQGTFGVVFVARDTELDRLVAFKLLNPVFQDNDQIASRFLQEARACARIGHPGIVTVLDIGRVPTLVGEASYIVMELLGGESLTRRLARSGRLAPESAIEIGRQIAGALEAAHRAEVLHRDLKPDNVFLVPDDAAPTSERVKVIDFGLAKIEGSRHTCQNAVFGTPRYMSPEQCRSATQIDGRSDVYALGCLLFELVTGKPPFTGDLRQLLEAHRMIAAPRARSLVPEVPEALDHLIDAMLAKDPAARPQSMLAVQMTLAAMGSLRPGVAETMMPTSVEHLLPEPPPAQPIAAPVMPFQPPMPQAPVRQRVRSPFKAALVAAVIVSATLAAISNAARIRPAEAAAPVAATTR